MKILLNYFWILLYSGAYIYYYQPTLFGREEILAVSSVKTLWEHQICLLGFNKFQQSESRTTSTDLTKTGHLVRYVVYSDLALL